MSAPISFAFHFAQNRGVGPQHPKTRDARRGKPRRVPTPALQRVPCRDDRAPRRSGVAGAGANSRSAPSTRSRARPRRVRRVETRARRRVPARRARRTFARAWKRAPRAPSMGYPNTSGSRTRGSRRARRRRAVSRTPWVWTRARGGSERGGDQGETVHLTRRGHVRSVQSALRRVRAVSHGRADEDDPSRNHRRQPSTDAREAKGGA